MTDFFKRLSARERWLVAGASVFVGLALLYGLFVSPLLESRQLYQRRAERKKQELARFRSLASEYRQLQTSLEDIERSVSSRGSETSLLAAMDAEARKLGLADRIASMKPFTSDLESGMVQSSVEMRIEKIDLKGLVEFVRGLEGGSLMARTTRLRIKARFDDPQLLDATILISTLEAP